MFSFTSEFDRKLDMRELFNVVTCAAYVVVGVLVVLWRSGLNAYTVAAWLIWLGVASGIYHYHEWHIMGERLDQSAMYGTFAALAVNAVTDHAWAWPVMVLGGVAVGWRLGWETDRVEMVKMVILQPVMILLGALVAAAVLFEGVWWMAPAALVSVGIAWWTWHKRKSWWGHGTWHLFTAATILLLFLGVR